MSKSFTHENERLTRQSSLPERTEAGTAAPTVEEQAARAAWQNYVGSLAPAAEPTERPGAKRKRPGVVPSPTTLETETGPDKAPT